MSVFRVLDVVLDVVFYCWTCLFFWDPISRSKPAGPSPHQFTIGWYIGRFTLLGFSPWKPRGRLLHHNQLRWHFDRGRLVNCWPLPTWAPYGKSLYKPNIIGVWKWVIIPKNPWRTQYIPWVVVLVREVQNQLVWFMSILSVYYYLIIACWL